MLSANRHASVSPRSSKPTQGRLGLQDKTLWDWLSLLLVPLLIGLGTIWVTAQQTVAQNASSQQLHDLDRQQHDIDQQIAQQARYDDLIRTYRDDIDTLLLANNLRVSRPESDVRAVARAKTLDILQQVDTPRKGQVILYLANLGLVQGSSSSSTKETGNAQEPIISLSRATLSGANLVGANLSGADLGEADLRGTNLSGTTLNDVNFNGADLESATLSGGRLQRANFNSADLTKADLSEAYLRGAILTGAILSDTGFSKANLSLASFAGAYLTGADFSGATLSDADLSSTTLSAAILSGAHLQGADLANAYLGGANLTEADLSKANLGSADLGSADLSGADLCRAFGVTNKELEKQAKSLKGTIMPDCTTHA